MYIFVLVALKIDAAATFTVAPINDVDTETPASLCIPPAVIDKPPTVPLRPIDVLFISSCAHILLPDAVTVHPPKFGRETYQSELSSSVPIPVI